MALNHPEVASRKCSDCHKWVYDEKTGAVLERPRGSGQRVERKPSQKPPCQRCPKKSPQEAHHYELSPKNLVTLSLYYRNRATFGRHLNEAESADELVSHNFAIIDRIMRKHESAETARNLEPLLALSNATQ